jgi:hypothetical protein
MENGSDTPLQLKVFIQEGVFSSLDSRSFFLEAHVVDIHINLEPLFIGGGHCAKYIIIALFGDRLHLFVGIQTHVDELVNVEEPMRLAVRRQSCEYTVLSYTLLYN